MWFLKKEKAGALQYVLVISVIIAFILFAFISLIYLQQKLQIKNAFYKETIQNVQLGFNYISDLPYDKPIETRLSENELEKTTFLRSYWGIFDIVSVSSSIKNEYFQKIGLIGNQNNQREALYLQDNNTPLVVVGHAKIKGNVSLPKQGVKSGNISGNSYYGNQLIYGSQKTSNTSLPSINNIAYIKSLFKRNYMNDSVKYFQLENGLKHTQLFSQPTAIHYTQDNIHLSDIALQGNIIIHSENTITIDATAKLEDIILIAPTIKILKKVTGNFQAFATDMILAEENCKLNYPSALVLIQNQKAEKENQIKIGENTNIKGVIVYYNEKDSPNFDSQIVLSEKTIITGEVYCNQNLELLGSVYGSIYTNNFIAKQSGSTYVNHIYNGAVNYQKLPEQYCGLWINNTSKKVAKWLY
ncbi:hypothetical protein H0I31_02165 [Tenacibaculum sp. AHE15PA]|uniref:hypothetical protein n=1 Tax=unclassified Tenacibaculum TaxID=2635139 RepID=UPI001C4F9363|nr:MULTISPECIES: hypothetical protein [unclassified Tenacibaculum]QXP72527.1 hypothetical protein H0I30_07420 [Tenacibaculum sp. AHE14PA]QXP76442.1 hypothetical protein H0I31_02165 [Tenacibaculum sp. AHE15PA]